MNCRPLPSLRLALAGAVLVLGRAAPIAPAPSAPPPAPATADTNAYQGAAWDRLDLDQVTAEAARLDPAHLPNCDAVLVDEKIMGVVQADGTGAFQDEKFVKILTERGRRSEHTVSEHYYEPYSKAEVTLLEVISPDGSVTPVDIRANESESAEAGLMRMNIYDPAHRVIGVNIPQLGIGDIVHSVIRVTQVRPIVEKQFSFGRLLEGTLPIHHLLLEVRLPLAMPLAAIDLNHPLGHTVTASVTTAGGLRLYRWEARDVPRMFPETGMPAFPEVLQSLEASTSGDWSLYSKWYWQLSQSHLNATTPEMLTRVAELTAGATTDLDKIKALFHYVSKDIRYMGVTLENDRPGFEPHDVSLTFERKYGVCRDKAALLVSLLRAAHLPAYPVLISVGWKKDPKVANPYFDHAIVAVELHPGDYTLMDPTDENTRDLLPAYDTDQSYLVCRPEGETLRVSPVFPPQKNYLRIATTAGLSDTGRLQARSLLKFDGVNDDIFRNIFAKMRPDERRRFFERELQASLPGVHLNSLKIAPRDMQDLATPLRVELGYSVDGMAAFGQGKAVVNLPWIGRNLGVVNFIVARTGLAERKYPLKNYFTCGIKEDLKLVVADRFARALSVPGSTSRQDPGIKYRRQLAFAGHTLSASQELAVERIELSPAQYLELKATMKSVAYDNRKTLIMEAREKPANPLELPAAYTRSEPVASNALDQSTDTELTVLDPHTARTHIHYVRKILSYEGKKAEAEIKIPFNPALREVTLDRATVTSPSGKQQQVTPDELHVMDQPWAALAKRYTGGKILVANLPGIEVGSTIEVDYTVKAHDLPFLAGFLTFQGPNELERKKFTLTLASNLPLHQRVLGAADSIKATTAQAQDQTTLTWTAEHVHPLPQEPQLPPAFLYESGVAYFVGDPAAYYRDLNRILQARAKQNPQAADEAKGLADQAPSKLAAVAAIRDFVAHNVRLAGPRFTDLPLSQLSDADTILADGYGHMADRAILLYSMLAAAGFDPDFVLASNLPDVPAVTAVTSTHFFPAVFDLPLVRVPVGDKTYYLNDTDQYAHLGTTPHDGRLGIDLNQGSYVKIAAAPDCRDGGDSSYTLTVADNGRTRLTIRHRYYGLAFNQRNRYFAELTPEGRKRYREGQATAIAQGARLAGPLKTDFSVYPGTETSSYDIDDYAVVDGKYLYLGIPFGSPAFRPRPDHRTLPILLPRNNWHTARVEVDLPAAFGRVDVAPQADMFLEPDDAGQTKIETEREQRNDGTNRFVLEYKSDYATTVLPPESYPALLRAESAMKNKAGKVLLVERDGPASPGRAAATDRRP